MAFNPNTIKFLIERIANSDESSLSSTVNHMFNYLSEEVKDNPIYDKLEKDKEKWNNWPSEIKNQINGWSIPNNIDDTKSLSYNLYKSIAELNDNGLDIFFKLYWNKYEDNLYNFNKIFLNYFSLALDDIINANPERDIEIPKKINGKTVFIIHGHDDNLKREVQLILKNAGVNNIVLHEQLDKGRSIIEKLIQETENSGYAIALLTPDDITKEDIKRARQNVILEIGYFLGKIGKERIRLILKDNIEIPSDLNGILYEKYDDKGIWKMKLLKEIQAVGIYVDFQSVINSL